MKAKGKGRSGMGIPVIIAASLPILIMIGSLAYSYQSSTVRRLTSSFYMTYLAHEIAESAVAEAAHFLQPKDIFDEGLFGSTTAVGPSLPTTEVILDFPAMLMLRMVDQTNSNPNPQIPRLPTQKVRYEYRSIMQGGSEVRKMLVAIHFPDGPDSEVWKPVTTPNNLGLELARQNPGIQTDKPNDIKVFVKPITFRREFYRKIGAVTFPHGIWVNWGVVQLKVLVRARELTGVVTHELKVDRRFWFKFNTPQGEEKLKVSSHNLRTVTRRL